MSAQEAISGDASIDEASVVLAESDEAEIMAWKATVEDRTLTDSTAATYSPHNDRSPEDLLRRLSSIQGGVQGHFDSGTPKIGANRSGRLINAVFCIPHTVQLSNEAQWVSLNQ